MLVYIINIGVAVGPSYRIKKQFYYIQIVRYKILYILFLRQVLVWMWHYRWARFRVRTRMKRKQRKSLTPTWYSGDQKANGWYLFRPSTCHQIHNASICAWEHYYFIVTILQFIFNSIHGESFIANVVRPNGQCHSPSPHSNTHVYVPSSSNSGKSFGLLLKLHFFVEYHGLLAMALLLYYKAE